MVATSSVSVFYKLTAYLRKYGLDKFYILRKVKQLVGRRLVSVSDTFVVDVHGQRMHFWSKEQWRAEALLGGYFEPYTTDLMREYIKDGDVFLDVGAHVGYYTLLAASLVGTKGSVIAFEPEAGNFRILKMNVKMNNHDNVKVVNKVASNATGVCDLYVQDVHTGSHSLFSTGQAKQMRLECTKIDDWFKASGLERIDVFKLDVEGAEPLVLEGMRELIDKSEDLKMFVEVNPGALKAAGYTVESFLKLLGEWRFKEIFLIDESSRQLFPVKCATDLIGINHANWNLLCVKN